jgi:predicted PurR-regulated permease PerM
MTPIDKMSETPPNTPADSQPAPVPAALENSSGFMAAEENPETKPLLQLPLQVRSLSLLILAMFASLWVLQWARAVFIPLMLGLILSYALSPVINWLEQRRMPRWLSAALLLLTIFCSIGSSAYVLSDEAGSLIDAIPAATHKFTHALKNTSNKSEGTLATMQKAASQLEQATQDVSPITNSKGAMRVVVESPRFKITDYLWTSTLGFAQFVGQFTVVVFLTYFLMVSGDTFRRKLIKFTGTSRARKKLTLQALDEITGQIQRYLQVQLFTSALVGLLTGIALALIGLENAVVWGVVAAVLNLVPYIGSLVMAAASALIGFLQFGSVNMALLVGGASLFIHAIIGNLITPWLTSRASRMNPVAVFVGLLSWGWLWGVWGLLLGIPILMIVKAVCDRVDELKPVGEFLGA